ncbi:hypothetical protein C8R47DRAFT_1261085 [Mycena vitilis]|nr:hypothetical protein C8R47DRAFT_1261085 [Mycena vitilis]
MHLTVSLLQCAGGVGGGISAYLSANEVHDHNRIIFVYLWLIGDVIADVSRAQLERARRLASSAVRAHGVSAPWASHAQVGARPSPRFITSSSLLPHLADLAAHTPHRLHPPRPHPRIHRSDSGATCTPRGFHPGVCAQGAIPSAGITPKSSQRPPGSSPTVASRHLDGLPHALTNTHAGKSSPMLPPSLSSLKAAIPLQPPPRHPATTLTAAQTTYTPYVPWRRQQSAAASVRPGRAVVASSVLGGVTARHVPTASPASSIHLESPMGLGLGGNEARDRDAREREKEAREQEKERERDRPSAALLDKRLFLSSTSMGSPGAIALDLNIPPDDKEFVRLCRNILNTCVRNTEDAERVAAERANGVGAAGERE